MSRVVDDDSQFFRNKNNVLDIVKADGDEFISFDVLSCTEAAGPDVHNCYGIKSKPF